MTASNQLKLNLNAVVDNLNLVNVVHKPQPIQFVKNSSYGRSFNEPSSSAANQFEIIDETKLSMYSYLVQRELKTKEWLSKYELGKSEPPPKVELNKPASQAPNKNPAPKPNTQKIQPKPKTDPPAADKPFNKFHSKPINDLEELKKCCEDTIRSLEHLESQLNEFKYERLKIVFNDPVEEEKQKRLQLEQIKYLSRSMYNLQNQMSRFSRAQLEQQANQAKNSISPMARLVHTMRQVIKSTGSFAEFYAYRPDNSLVAEKLCAHFYKQLRLSIENFNASGVPAEVAGRLSQLLDGCDKYFDDYSQVESDAKHTSEQKSKKQVVASKGSVVNVIRTARTGVNGSGQLKSSSATSVAVVEAALVPPIKKISKMNIIDARSDEENFKASLRLDISPPRKLTDKQNFTNKKVKTARLFPAKSNKQKPKFRSNSRPSRSQSRQQQQQIQPKENIKPDERNRSFELLNQSIESLQLNNSGYQPAAFSHLSSPKVKRVPSKDRSRSAEKIKQMELADRLSRQNTSLDRNRSFNSSYSESGSPSRYRPDFKHFSHDNDGDYDDLTQDFLYLKRKYGPSLENLRADFNQTHDESFMLDEHFIKKNFNNQRKAVESKGSMSILKNNNLKMPQTTQKLLSKLDVIKKENDSIRRKYEKLNYHQDLVERALVDSKARRPYEECYLENKAVVTEQYEAKVDFNKVYKQLRPPNMKQLQRVLGYADKFDDYNQKTSITTIGESTFDDYELFEYISDALYEDCFNSVYSEVENINDELAANLINAEFSLNNQSQQIKNDTTLLEDRNQAERKNISFDKSVVYSSRQPVEMPYYGNTSYSSFQTEENAEEEEEEEEKEDSLTSISS